jgi:hypothetical protein
VTTSASGGSALSIVDTTPAVAALGERAVRFAAGAGSSTARLTRLSVDQTGNSGAGGTPRPVSMAGEFWTGAGGGRAPADSAYVRGPVVLMGNTVVDAGIGGVFFQSAVNSDSASTPRDLTLRSAQRPLTSDLDPPAQAAAEVSGVRAPFRFGGDLGASARLGAVVFEAMPQPFTGSQGAAATILFSRAYGEGEAFGRPLVRTLDQLDAPFVVRAGTFDVGAGHRMTVFGSLDLAAMARATLTDITVAGSDLTVDAPVIEVRRRQSSRIVNERFESPRDTFRQASDDPGTSFVSGERITFRGAGQVTVLGPAGDGRDPQFATPLLVERDASDPLRVFLNRRIDSFLAGGRVAAFQATGAVSSGGQFLALTIPATGPTSTRPFDAGALPKNEEIRQVNLPPATLSDEAARDLRQMGLGLKPFDLTELLRTLVGRAVYQDAVRDSGRNQWVVSPSLRRVNIEAVRSALETWYDLVGVRRDEDGFPIRNEDGDLVTDQERIRASLAASWRAYAASAGEPSGRGFADHLGRQRQAGELAGDDLEALRAIARLHNILVDLEDSNLSAYELGLVRATLIEGLAGGEPSTATLGEAVDAVPGAVGESADEGDGSP